VWFLANDSYATVENLPPLQPSTLSALTPLFRSYEGHPSHTKGRPTYTQGFFSGMGAGRQPTGRRMTQVYPKNGTRHGDKHTLLNEDNEDGGVENLYA